MGHSILVDPVFFLTLPVGDLGPGVDFTLGEELEVGVLEEAAAAFRRAIFSSLTSSVVVLRVLGGPLRWLDERGV